MSTPSTEMTGLLVGHGDGLDDPQERRKQHSNAYVTGTLYAGQCLVISAMMVAAVFVLVLTPSSSNDGNWPMAMAKSHKNHKHKKESMMHIASDGDPTTVVWDPPSVLSRCEWVVGKMIEGDVTLDRLSELQAVVVGGNNTTTTIVQDEWDALQDKYSTQSKDANVFYRATANLFWHDFVQGQWGLGLTQSLRGDALLENHQPLSHRSTWTWVTGDQHLSNFGAWQNRHGDVVFGVNDFDEAAIYDFQIDVLRIAVSVFNHGRTNGFSEKDIVTMLDTFTDTYVKTVLSYLDNEDALLFELTKDTTSKRRHKHSGSGSNMLNDFLKKVEDGKSRTKQQEKFTTLNADGTSLIFQKGPFGGEADPDSKLTAVSDETHAAMVNAFSATQYGATMMQLGWAVREWDDDFFHVLDVAERVGSGVGSFGVARYYVLLQGHDPLGESTDDAAVVLDVKYEPGGAVSDVLTPSEQAWYDNLFSNAAERSVMGQRKLTSYTDPYLGWVMLPDENSDELLPFAVRQRSPWKDSPKLEKLTTLKDFTLFMDQIATATATSHVRGSVAKAPGDFKSVIDALLSDKKDREVWGDAVAELAASYAQQVELDFQCFHDFVDKYFSEEEEEEG